MYYVFQMIVFSETLVTEEMHVWIDIRTNLYPISDKQTLYSSVVAGVYQSFLLCDKILEKTRKFKR